MVKLFQTRPELNLLRIGSDEKIESDAKRFEANNAVMKWQKEIVKKAEEYWKKFEQDNSDLLLSVKKKSYLIDIDELSKKRKELGDKILETVKIINQDFRLSVRDMWGTSEYAIIEYVDEKQKIEDSIIKSIKKYTEKYEIEFPENVLFSQWIDNESIRLKKIVGSNNEKYNQFINRKKIKEDWCERLKRNQADLMSIFIENVNVIGGTCLGIANLFKTLKSKENIKFDWVIIDESGRSTPAETFVPMSRGKKIILVGDHKQLPPVVDKELADKAYEQNEIQRKILEESLFEYLYEQLPDSNKITLNHQYRMHPHIGQLVSYLFYDNAIISEKVSEKEKSHSLSFEKVIYWITTSDEKEKNIWHTKVGTSFSNSYEADIIKELLNKVQEDCEKRDIKKEIAVITAYSSQKRVLETRISSKDERVWKNLDIAIHTVDSFQGKECDIVIYDLVRSSKDKQLGFTSDYRRLNVALSRAKQLLFIVGNDRMAYEGRTPDKKIENPFRRLIEYIAGNHDCKIIPSKTVRQKNVIF